MTPKGPSQPADEALERLRGEIATLRRSLGDAELAADAARDELKQERQRKQALVKANNLLDRELFRARLTHEVLQAAEVSTDLDQFCQALLALLGRVVSYRWTGLRLSLDGTFHHCEAPGPDPEGEAMLQALADGGTPVAGLRRPFAYTFQRSGFVLGHLLCLPEAGAVASADRQILTDICRQATPILERHVLIRRLEELDSYRADFVHMLSHDLRNPLTGVISALSTLQLPGLVVEPDDRETLIQAALKSARLANDMIGDLLDVARLDAGRLEVAMRPLDLAALAADAIEQQRYVAKAKDLALVLDLAPGLGEVDGEAKKLSRVFINLIANALKYTQRGGVLVRLSPAAAGVEVTIADTGMGVPGDAQAHLFEKFYQVAGRHRAGLGGTGLGLTFCREMIEAHGGHIAVESPSAIARDSRSMPTDKVAAGGQGSAFRFTLPTRAR